MWKSEYRCVQLMRFASTSAADDGLNFGLLWNESLFVDNRGGLDVAGMTGAKLLLQNSVAIQR